MLRQIIDAGNGSILQYLMRAAHRLAQVWQSLQELLRIHKLPFEFSIRQIRRPLNLDSGANTTIL